jgi:hypothetical protein
MESIFKVKTGKWFLVVGLLLSICMSGVSYAQTTSLTDMEKSWLTYMREEEKLARDVYLVLYAKWGIPVFSNIAKSEQTHMDAIRTLLDRYGLQDPAAGNASGVFVNQHLQELYTALIEQGNISAVEALRVGVEIEETDIDDLTSAIAATTTRRKDIKKVYTNLMNGSLNHLKAFVSNLASMGVTYEP